MRSCALVAFYVLAFARGRITRRMADDLHPKYMFEDPEVMQQQQMHMQQGEDKRLCEETVEAG